MLRALQNLIRELEQDRSLDEPDRLRQRIEALDRLDAYLLDGQLPTLGVQSIEGEMYQRARALYAKLEDANFELYQAIRHEIQRGAGPGSLLRWVPRESARGEDAVSVPSGESYDYLDDLVSGVLQFENPGPGVIPLAAEMVFYQPTPSRHIFDLIARTALTETDVLVDLGSGLGHVSLLASICTGARNIGIELEAACVECARHSAKALNLDNVIFVKQDAREADLSGGTVFYLYTPFTGTILRAVLDSLRREAASREIRICTFGPCTPTIAEQRWLDTLGPSEVDGIAVFRSRS